MKHVKATLLLIALAVLPQAAFAELGPDSSWGEIRSAGGVTTMIPQIWLGNVAVPVTELCVDGQRLRPHQPERTESKPLGDHGLHYDIRVMRFMGSSGDKFLFVKPFDIPACDK